MSAICVLVHCPAQQNIFEQFSAFSRYIFSSYSGFSGSKIVKFHLSYKNTINSTFHSKVLWYNSTHKKIKLCLRILFRIPPDMFTAFFRWDTLYILEG